jgi:hypothetical protein
MAPLSRLASANLLVSRSVFTPPHLFTVAASADVLFFQRPMSTRRHMRLTTCYHLLRSQRLFRYEILSVTKRTAPSTHANSSHSNILAPTAMTRMRRLSATTRVRARSLRSGSCSRRRTTRARRPSRPRYPSMGGSGRRPTRVRYLWRGFASRLPSLLRPLRKQRRGLWLLVSRMQSRRRRHLR